MILYVSVPGAVRNDRNLHQGAPTSKVVFQMHTEAHAAPFRTDFGEHDLVHDETSPGKLMQVRNHVGKFLPVSAPFVQSGVSLSPREAIASMTKDGVQDPIPRVQVRQEPLRAQNV